MSMIENLVSNLAKSTRLSASKLTHCVEYIYGINPVLASLSAQRREFQRLYMNITER
jgi:hypothetical protein